MATTFKTIHAQITRRIDRLAKQAWDAAPADTILSDALAARPALLESYRAAVWRRGEIETDAIMSGRAWRDSTGAFRWR